MNRIVVVGRICKDPEIKSVKDTSVVDFSVAVNKKFKPKEGADADFFRVKVWGQAGKFVHEYLGKGRLVSIDGRMDSNTFEKDGVKRTEYFITADDVRALDRPTENKPASKKEAKPYCPFEDED